MVSQRVIANQLNISQRTVSLCLAGSDRVADETRRRVLEAAQDLGYRPNRSARAIRSGRFNALALLQSTHSDYSFLPQDLLTGLQTKTADRQNQLVIASVPDEKLVDDDFLPSVLREWSVDGFIINYNYGFSPRMVNVIEDRHLPSVWLNVKRSFDCVYPDDIGAGRKMTRELIKLGHRRIAFFSHRKFEDHFSVGDRYAGYEQAMRAGDLPPRRLFYNDTHWDDAENGIRFVRSFLDGPDRPTALVTYESFEAMRAMLVAFQLGMQVPRDLSIVTFNERAVKNGGFPIATLQVPNRAMGEIAVEMLLGQVDGGDARQAPVVLEFTSLSNGSMGPPTLS